MGKGHTAPSLFLFVWQARGSPLLLRASLINPGANGPVGPVTRHRAGTDVPVGPIPSVPRDALPSSRG